MNHVFSFYIFLSVQQSEPLRYFCSIGWRIRFAFSSELESNFQTSFTHFMDLDSRHRNISSIENNLFHQISRVKLGTYQCSRCDRSHLWLLYCSHYNHSNCVCHFASSNQLVHRRSFLSLDKCFWFDSNWRRLHVGLLYRHLQVLLRHLLDL